MNALTSDIEFIRAIMESSGVKVVYGSVYKKNIKKVMRSVIAAKKLPGIISEIEATGRSTVGGTHTIGNAPNFRSEVTGEVEMNWIIVPVSMKEDIRLMFKFYPTINTVEIRGVGRASDIGYKH